MDELLDRVSRDVADGRYAAVVSTHGGLCSIPWPRGIDEPRIEIIVNGDEAERAAALAVALARIATPRSAARTCAATEARPAAPAERRGQPDRLHPGPTVVRARRRVRGHARADANGGEVPPLSVETVRRHSRAPRSRAIFSRKTCSPIQRGTCCSICCRRRSRSFACRSPACASPRPCRRRRRCAGSRRWSARTLRSPRRSARRPAGLRRARAGGEPGAPALFRRGRAGRGDLTSLRRAAARGTALRRGRLAQLVEHLVYTERVGGSSPSAPTSRH